MEINDLKTIRTVFFTRFYSSVY